MGKLPHDPGATAVEYLSDRRGEENQRGVRVTLRRQRHGQTGS